MPSKPDAVAALILAGGLSSRMGQEKATLMIKSRPLISWAYDAANRFTNHIYISSHDESMTNRFRPLLPADVVFIADLYDGPRSVLLALLSSFQSIKEEYIIVFPVDSPLIRPNLMAEMVSKSKEFDLVIPVWPDGKLEAIHAVYDREATLPVIRDLWHSRTLELWQIAKHAKKTLFISTERLAELDPGLVSLLDADTPDEFETLKSVAANYM
ncbi:MAG: molybdenum cofactor guanylyltransferase [Conexivisphaerales archaeon]